MIKVLYFWNQTSIPSQLMKPVINDLSNELINYEFKIINTKNNKQSIKNHLITGLPTTIITRDDEEIGRVIGYKNKNDLKLKIEEIIFNNELK